MTQSVRRTVQSSKPQTPYRDSTHPLAPAQALEMLIVRLGSLRDRQLAAPFLQGVSYCQLLCCVHGAFVELPASGAS